MGFLKKGANNCFGEKQMKLKGIILTGTSGSGKTTIANMLLFDKNKQIEVKALTTRQKRKEDNGHYIYTDNLNYEELRKIFFTSTEYRNEKYAITKSEIYNAINSGRLAIIVISPESYGKLKEEDREGFLSFFIDADDAQLDERLTQRDGERLCLKEKKIDCLQMLLTILFKIMIL